MRADVGEVRLGGGLSIVCKYARLAKRPAMHQYRKIGSKLGLVGQLTDAGIRKHEEEAGVVYPFDLEPATDTIPFRECSLNVLRFELGRKAREGQNSCY